MIDIALPDGTAPTVLRSFAACLAATTETPVSHLPEPAADLDEALGRRRTWLAGRGARLVPLARPERFNWPGYRMAFGEEANAGALGEPVAVLMFATPAGVALSPEVPQLLGRAAADLPVIGGFVAALLDPVPVLPIATPLPRGTVEPVGIVEPASGGESTEPTALSSSH